MARFQTALASALFLLLLLAPSASAQRNCPGGSNNGPPGQSEVDQYSETVPGPCGDQPVGPGAGGGSGGGTPLPAGVLEDLEALGPDGAAAAALAQATGPGKGSEGSGGPGSSGGEAGDASGLPEASAGGSLLAGVVDAITGGAGDGDEDGLGLILPLILLAVVVAGVIYGLRRRLAD